MTKDVLVSVKGLHSVKGADSHTGPAGNKNPGQDEDDTVELISAGKYYFRNGKHYVEYEELEEETNTVIKNRITLRDRHLEVIRKAPFQTKMIFEENTKNTSWYNTPVGSMLAGFDVNEMQIRESDDLIEIGVDYALEINYEHVSDSHIQIRIMAKDSGLFHLT
ncbi:MAG: DUF1934 domain-containing protein [Clostridiales bacterium]|nr:DUF1934 domain-containing protein [Clostridiales bacterium]